MGHSTALKLAVKSPEDCRREHHWLTGKSKKKSVRKAHLRVTCHSSWRRRNHGSASHFIACASRCRSGKLRVLLPFIWGTWRWSFPSAARFLRFQLYGRNACVNLRRQCVVINVWGPFVAPEVKFPQEVVLGRLLPLWHKTGAASYAFLVYIFNVSCVGAPVRHGVNSK